MIFYSLNIEAKQNNITSEIEECISKHEIDSGVMFIQVLTKDSCVYVGKDNNAVQQDIKEEMQRLIPAKLEVESVDGKALAYSIRSSIVGRSIALEINNRKVLLGEFEQILIMTFNSCLKDIKVEIAILPNI